MRHAATIASPLLGIVVLLGVVPVPKTKQSLTLGQTYCTGSTPCTLTYHNDNNRDAVNSNEGAFKASTLSSSNHPVPQWLATTDGQIYGQPLYVHQLQVNNDAKNVVYVVTENNSVYAMDSDSTSSTGTILAATSLNDASDLAAGSTEIALPFTDLPMGCSNIVPEIGITGTPVIDVSVTPPVLYVVTKHEDVDSQGAKTYRQKLHGLFVDTLREIPGSPLILDSAFSAAHTKNVFNPVTNNQRAGLALVNGSDGTARIWVSWGSHCDSIPYHGLAIEFTYNYTGTVGFANAYTVFDSEATCIKHKCQAGIWMGGAAPAVDSQGNVYLATGNGDDTFQAAGEFSNSVLKLNDAGLQDFYSPPDFDAINHGKTLVACTNPSPARCFAPCQLDSTGQYCQVTLVPEDWDLGTTGVVLLAPTFPLHDPELVTSGKQGMLYVLFAGKMGQFDSQTSNPDRYACTTATIPTPGAIVQCFMGPALHNNSMNPNSGGRGGLAFLAGQTGTAARNYLYIAGVGDFLRAYVLTNSNGLGVLNTWPSTPSSPHRFLYPGAVLAVTWQSTKGNISDAIVWALDTSGYGTQVRTATGAVLYAYKAIPSKMGTGSLGASLWDTSAYNNVVPGNPGAIKFMSPTVVDGKLFIAGGAQGYQPATSNCPTPSPTIQPTACGGLAMYK